MIDNGITTEAETESVTVSVSRNVPTAAVSDIFKSAVPAVDVSSVIPAITGESEYL